MAECPSCSRPASDSLVDRLAGSVCPTHGRFVAPSDQWRHGGQPVGKELEERAIHEFRGSKDERHPVVFMQGIERGDAEAPSAVLK